MSSALDTLLKVGVILPTRNVVTGGTVKAVETMKSMVSIATALEKWGCDSVWVGDSLLGRPRPEPLTVLAAISAVTTHLTLGTSALLPAMRHPLQLLQQLATVDVLSDGRLIVGVGSGYPNDQTRHELEALNISFQERVRRCHEVVDWCRANWGASPPGEPRFFQLSEEDVWPRPVQAGGPDFWLGGATKATCRRVGIGYAGWMPTCPSPERYAESWQLIQEYAREAGRDPASITGSTVLTIAVDEDESQAQDQLRTFIERYYVVSLEEAQEVVGCRAGTVEDMVKDIRQFQEAGVTHFQLRFATDDQESEIKRWIPCLLEALGKRGARQS